MVKTRHGKEYTFWHPFQVRDPELRQLFSDSDMISKPVIEESLWVLEIV